MKSPQTPDRHTDYGATVYTVLDLHAVNAFVRLKSADRSIVRRRIARLSKARAKGRASMTAARKRRRVGGLRKRCEHRPEQWPKCPHAWHINFQWRGVHYRISLDRHLGKHIEAKGDAEDAAADIKKAIKAGRFGEQLPAKEVLTLEQLLSTYINEYVTPERPRSLVNVKYQAGAIGRHE